MATSKLSEWGGWCTSQLMIVLLGGRNSGKSFLGNLLLGKEEFVLKERTSCSRRLGLVAGRWLTVVDTPGWWCDFSVQDTSELVKREILNSVSLCLPGPHVFLIAVKLSSAFSEKRRRAVEEHVSLLGEGVWSHCMIVFTSADRSKHTAAEKHVRAGGTALHWLSEKCSQRCHSVTLRDDTEVTELLKKVQKLVMENGNRVFEMQQNILQATAEEKRSVEDRAQQRFMRTKKHRFLMRERLRSFTSIRMVLLGAKGSGKTSALNTILSRETRQPLRRTVQCLVGKGVVFGREVTAVDTPGWWMNYFCKETSVFDRREMVLSLSLCPPGPHVFLLVIRVDRAFTETYRRAVQEHLQLISDHIWSRVIVLFSCGDWLGGTTTEQYIESEGEPLQWLVERCGNRYHVLNNKTKGDEFQVRELIGKIEEMLSGCDSGWHYEIERKVVDQLLEAMRREKERAEQRLIKKEKQRRTARAQLEKLNLLPEINIVLVGGRKTGKSSCGNTILNRECFNTDTRATTSTEKQGKISGKMVTVLDTPDCFSATSELLMPSCALLLVVNVSSSFKVSHWEAIEKQMEAGGGQLWSRAVVLFSYGDWLGNTSVEQHIESEGELLQKLVEKCGNRYHVLDNKHWGDGAQVAELIELLEEMLVEERLAVLHREDHLWKSVSSFQQQQPEAATLHKKDFRELMIHRCPLSCDLTESAISSSCPSLNCSEGPDAAGQIVALPPRRAGRAGRTVLDRDALMSMLSGREGLRWTTTVELPAWFPTDNPHGQVRLSGQVRLFSHTLPTMLLVTPETQDRTLVEQSAVTVHSRSPTALREQTLRRLTESGGLQTLIDQWGDNSLEELEAFIDSYFEMVWEQTMRSCHMPESECVTTEQDAVVKEAGGEVLSSIDRKLSKLEILEEIRNDMTKLRESLEHSCKAIQEIIDRTKQDADNTS